MCDTRSKPFHKNTFMPRPKVWHPTRHSLPIPLERKSIKGSQYKKHPPN